jgi:plasmid stabilization system protein ParE
MPKYLVALGGSAQRDIIAILEWMEPQSRQGAARWYQALLKAVGVLADHAERFPIARESRHFTSTVRYAPFRTRKGRTYHILFTVNGLNVDVIAVRSPGQDELKP